MPARAATSAVTLSERMRGYEQILAGAAALFAANEGSTGKRWGRYVERLDLPGRFPGIVAVGYAPLVAAADVPALEAAARRDGLPAFRIYPPGVRSAYAPIMHVEPAQGVNLDLLGYDMLSEPTRRAAMERARDSGHAEISGSLRLRRDTGAIATPAFLMYAPVYRGRSDLSTPDERRSALSGYVSIAFYAHSLFGALLTGADMEGIDVHVYDGAGSEAVLLYDSAAASGHHADSHAAAACRRPGAGRRPKLAHRSECDARVSVSVEQQAPWLLVVMGGVASLLCSAWWSAETRTRDRAQRIAQDITAQLRARQRELEVQSELLDAVVQSVPVQLTVKDAQHRLVLVNRAAEAFLNRPASELIGLTDFDIYSPERAQIVRSQDLRVLESGSLEDLEATTVDGRGGHHWVVKRKRTVSLPDGTRGVLTCIDDVTERKHAELQAERSRTFLQAVMNATSQYVSVKDSESRFVVVNEAFARTFGRPVEWVVGRDDYDLFAPEDAARYRAEDRSVLREGLALELEARLRIGGRTGTLVLEVQAPPRAAGRQRLCRCLRHGHHQAQAG